MNSGYKFDRAIHDGDENRFYPRNALIGFLFPDRAEGPTENKALSVEEL